MTNLRGSVIIPAHNEGTVLARTLRELSPLAVAGLLDLIVVANGCTDDTVRVAESFPRVVVLSRPEAGKPGALNAGDVAATAWPRLYLDADIEISSAATLQVLDQVQASPYLAARPSFKYHTEGCSGLVRAFYRVKDRIPEMRQHLWGAGAYAVTEEGHRRFTTFPDIVADDLFVDRLFAAGEKVLVDCEPVIVRCPRTVRALLGTLRRVYTGATALSDSPTTRPARGAHRVLRTVNGASSAIDAAVYTSLVILARLSGMWRKNSAWNRDQTQRVAEKTRPPSDAVIGQPPGCAEAH